jgi:hypothetical protein
MNSRPWGSALTLETLSKPILIHDQDWYKTAVCIDCPEFNFIPLPEGGAGFCNRIEGNRPCMFESNEADGDDDTSMLLDVENVPVVQAD